MLSDVEMKRLNENVVSIYQEMELDMLNKLGTFLSRNDKIGGTAKWYIKKLEEISNLNGDLVKTVSQYTSKTEEAIRSMLEEACIANFSSFHKENEISLSKLKENFYVQEQIDYFANDVGRNLSKIRTNTINATKEEYLRIVDKATLETSSGVKSFSESITDSLKELAEKGISGQKYERSNGDVVEYSAEGLVRRDTITAVFNIANKCFVDQAKTLGIEYVYVSQHLGARTSDKSKIANHAGWQGKIYKLNGSDEKYGNLVEETGYGDIEGLGGVNCRHRISAATEDMKLPDRIDEEKNAEMEKIFKRQRAMERILRSWKRKMALMKASGNEEEYKKAKYKVEEWSSALDKYTKENNIRRDFSREREMHQ